MKALCLHCGAPGYYTPGSPKGSSGWDHAGCSNFAPADSRLPQEDRADQKAALQVQRDLDRTGTIGLRVNPTSPFRDRRS